MITYPNNDKDEIISRMLEHIEADQLVKGQYWEDGKGCAIACLTHSNDHQAAADMLGIDLRMAHLYDAIFEGLPSVESRDWSLQFLGAIPEGRELNTAKVWYQWASRLLTRAKSRIGEGEEPWRQRCHEAVGQVIALCDHAAAGEVVTNDEWLDARDAAADAAGAAGAAAWAAWAAAGAAWAAAWAAGDAAGDAARAAGDAGDAARAAAGAAWGAAWYAGDAAGVVRDDEYRAQRHDLLDLLKSA
jgi:hypothetical protein